MKNRIDIPIGWNNFPQRCVHCGALPEATVKVECSRGMDLIIFKYQTLFKFLLPVCLPCRKRRRFAGFMSYLIIPATFIAYMAGVAALESVFERWDQREIWAFLLIGGVLLVFYLARNWVTPLLDNWFLGVRGGQLSKTNIGTIWFRDHDFAAMLEAFVRKDKGVLEKLGTDCKKRNGDA
jgi:hypothetical protein